MLPVGIKPHVPPEIPTGSVKINAKEFDIIINRRVYERSKIFHFVANIIVGDFVEIILWEGYHQPENKTIKVELNSFLNALESASILTKPLSKLLKEGKIKGIE